MAEVFAALAKVAELERKVKQHELEVAKLRSKDPLLKSEIIVTQLDPASGESSDQWKLEKRLGAGAFGIVYKAKRITPHSTRPNNLAIKLFPWSAFMVQMEKRKIPKKQKEKEAMEKAQKEAKDEYDILTHLDKEALVGCVIK